MKIKLTSYTDNDKEVISRTFDFEDYDINKMHFNLDNFVYDSQDYEKETQVELSEHEHADSVDADGTCLECGKTDLI